MVLVARIACPGSFSLSLLTVKLLAYVHAASFWCDEAYYVMLMTLRIHLPLPHVLAVDHNIA